jgi:hypothetical protein
MERYRDINGDSGVLAYETGPDFIRVQFKDHSVYLYTYISAGSHNIERMKSLAAAGDGLNACINTNVKTQN